MPMDIRNFFGKAAPKKPAVDHTTTKIHTNKNKNNNNNNNKANPSAASSSSNNDNKANKTATSTKASTATATAKTQARRPTSQETLLSSSLSKVAPAAAVEKKPSSSSSSSYTTGKGKSDNSSQNNNNHNNNNNTSSKQKQETISVDSDREDDDMDKVGVTTNKKQPQTKVQPPKKKSDPPSSKKKNQKRVIIDDSDDEDDDNNAAAATVTTKASPNVKASPAKTKHSSSTALNDADTDAAADATNDKQNDSAASTRSRQTLSLASAPPANKSASANDSRVEVSVNDYFAAATTKSSSQFRTSKSNADNGKAISATTTRHQDDKSPRAKPKMDDSENDDDEVGKDEDDDEDFVGDQEEEDDEQDINFDDEDEEYDDKNKKKKKGSKTVPDKRSATKRKMESDHANKGGEVEPPPRKSPRKAALASPNSSHNDVSTSSTKPPFRTSPRKQTNAGTNAATTTPAAVATTKSIATKSKATTTAKSVNLSPLQPGLQLDSFDVNAVVVPECLAGTTFVFSGLMEHLPRDDAQEMVKTLGGRVTGSVSNKTTYLVLGDVLEDGRPVHEGKKYQGATDKGVKLVHGEKELYGLMKLYHDRAQQNAGGFPHSSPVIVAKEMPKISGADPSESNSNEPNLKPPPPTKPIINTYAKKPPPGAAAATAPAQATMINPYAKKVTNPYASQKPKSTSTVSSQPAASTAPSSDTASSNRLWADKYAPQVSQEVLGNKDSVDKLAKWLQRWETTFGGNVKVKTSDTGPKKAALLSGPPGIGKTTTATLVAKEAGRDIVEFNASDVRSKKALQNDLGDVTGSQSINFAAAAAASNMKSGKAQTTGSATRKRVLIMDEVDGMGAGDRNGMAELIKMIKASHVPIICICNDRQSQKIRSLVPHCLDLRFRRPPKAVIANRAIKVAAMEGLQVERNAAEAIAESCGNDVRQVLNCLQMWASQGHQGGGDRMTYKDLKERENLINKDDILRVSIFDATKMIVEGRRGLNDGADKRTQLDSFFKRYDAFFVDYRLMGLNVHQNYMKVLMAPYHDVKRADDAGKMTEFLDRMHDAAHAMSDFAVVEREVRGGDMNWSLLPFAGLLTVKTGFHAGGEHGSFFPGFPDFPAWMGKNSTRGKKARILQELSYHMNYKVSGGRSELRLSYVPTLRERLYSMIANSDESDTTNAIQLMDEYGLDRDDVFERLDEFKIDSKVDFSKIEGKAKAAFTREYNSASHKSQALVAEQGAGASKRKRGEPKAAEKDPADLDAIDEDGPLLLDESENGDEDGVAAEDEDFEKIKKIFGKSKGGGGKKSAGQKGSTSTRAGKGNNNRAKSSTGGTRPSSSSSSSKRSKK